MSILMFSKRIFNKLYVELFIRSFKQKREYLINKGCKIGEDTRIHNSVSSFGSEPYLIEIGNNCTFAFEVMFFTHDGGVSVLNNLNMLEGADKMARIRVGNNVFIGYRAIVMPGVIIGDNVVIGAGSIVTKNIPSNSVAAGVPAKVISTIDEYYKNCKDHVDYLTNMNYDEKRKYFRARI